MKSIFNVNARKAGEQQKVVLLYLWHTIVKPLGGFSGISSADFCTRKLGDFTMGKLIPIV